MSRTLHQTVTVKPFTFRVDYQWSNIPWTTSMGIVALPGPHSVQIFHGPDDITEDLRKRWPQVFAAVLDELEDGS